MATRQTQERIIRTAVALFNEHGTGAVSANRIADACGISKGNLYYHFKTKQEIIQSVFHCIVAEMNGWYEDHHQPTLAHMAEMFARQLLLILEYRFFYREMPALLRADPLLLRRYRENRERRMQFLEAFFMRLDDNGALQLGGDRHLIRSLVHSTWIISDNWLNSIEFLGTEANAETIMQGYDLILEILKPYFPCDEQSVLLESHAAIRRHVMSQSRASA